MAFIVPRGPRDRFRLVLRPAGLLNPSLENTTCRRRLCPNGTVLESVDFTKSRLARLERLNRLGTAPQRLRIQ